MHVLVRKEALSFLLDAIVHLFDVFVVSQVVSRLMVLLLHLIHLLLP